MEENTIVEITENQIREQLASNSKKIVRSSPYPAITVNESFDFSLKINKQFAIADVSREEIANAMELSAGSIVREISSCVQYGWLIKNTSEGKYKLSDLFFQVFRPESERERKLGLVHAFGSPKLYSELIGKLDNNVIPNELKNTLVKSHNIREEVAQSAVDTFIESGKQVGVINDNKLLKYKLTISTLEKTQYAVIEEIEINDNNSTAVNNQNSLIHTYQGKEGNIDKKNINIPIHLTGNKLAFFVYPNDITENDVKIVEHQLAGVLLRIKLENEEKNEGVIATPS